MVDDELQLMAARLLGESPSAPLAFDVPTLLTRAEALCNARASLERALARGPITPAEDEQGWRFRMHAKSVELINLGAKLIADFIGEEAFSRAWGAEGDEESRFDKRAALTLRLRLCRPLLSKPNWSETLQDLIREVEDMDGGDEPTILAPEKRLPGQAKQPTKIARMRLRALCWNEHLKAKGVPTPERQAALVTAYKTGWEAIRKWRESCESAFGHEGVTSELARAKIWYWADYDSDNWSTMLADEGSLYWDSWKTQRGKN